MQQSVPAMRAMRIGCEFNHVAQSATPAAFQVRPGVEARVVRELWTTDPVIETGRYTDLYGTEVRRLMLPAGESLVSYYAVVEVPDEVDEADPAAPALRAQGVV